MSTTSTKQTNLTILDVTVAVFIGALAAMFVYEGIGYLRVYYSHNKLEKQAKYETQKQQAYLLQQEPKVEPKRVQMTKAMQALRAQIESQQREALIVRLQSEREDRKNKAWQEFYQPSPECLVDSLTNACANAHISAKKRFEAQYIDK